MSVSEPPSGPLWTTSQIFAALIFAGTAATLGMLPILLLLFYFHIVVFRLAFRAVKLFFTKSRDGAKHVARLRRSERLKAAVRQAQALVQVAPQITDARDYGEVRSLLANVPKLKASDLSDLKTLNDAEHRMLEAVQSVHRAAPSHADYLGTIANAQKATAAFLKLLSNTPALPAPELADGWLSFHEETRMSVQEIQNTLGVLQQKAQAVAVLHDELQSRVDNGETAQDPDTDLKVKEEQSLDAMLMGLDGKLKALPDDAHAKTFQDLFELAQTIDAAFIAADRQPPSKLGLIPDDVRRVHQIETFLSFYREKLDKLEAEKKDGTVDDSTYQTMKSSWERALESEMSAFEAAE